MFLCVIQSNGVPLLVDRRGRLGELEDAVRGGPELLGGRVLDDRLLLEERRGVARRLRRSARPRRRLRGAPVRRGPRDPGPGGDPRGGARRAGGAARLDFKRCRIIHDIALKIKLDNTTRNPIHLDNIAIPELERIVPEYDEHGVRTNGLGMERISFTGASSRSSQRADDGAGGWRPPASPGGAACARSQSRWQADQR